MAKYQIGTLFSSPAVEWKFSTHVVGLLHVEANAGSSQVMSTFDAHSGDTKRANPLFNTTFSRMNAEISVGLTTRDLYRTTDAAAGKLINATDLWTERLTNLVVMGRAALNACSLQTRSKRTPGLGDASRGHLVSSSGRCILPRLLASRPTPASRSSL